MRSGLNRLLLFCLLSMAIFASITLFAGRYFISATHEQDIVNYFYPLTVFHHYYVSLVGDLPIYMPQLAFGFDPAMAGQHGVNFPWRLLFFRLFSDVHIAADMLAFAQILVGGVFAGLTARSLGASLLGAATASASYMFGTMTLVWMGLFHSPAFFAGYGIALFGVMMLHDDRRLIGWLSLATGLSWCMLGGHLQNAHMLYHGIAVALATSLVIKLSRRENARRLFWFIALSASAILFSLVLSAPTGISFALLQLGSSRQGAPDIAIDTLTLRHLLFLVRPLEMRGNGNYFLSFLGLPLLVAFILGKTGSSRLLPAMAVLVFSALVGTGGLLFDLLVQLVPGWKVVSNIERMAFMFTLPLALFCGLGMTAVQRDLGLIRATPAARSAFLSATLVLAAALLLSRGEIHSLAQDAVLVGFLMLFLLALGQRLFAPWLAKTLTDHAPVLRVSAVVAATVLAFSLWRDDVYGYARPLADMKTYFWIVLAALTAFLLFLQARLKTAALIALAVLMPVAGQETSRIGWRAAPPMPEPRARATLDLIAAEESASERWVSYCMRNDAGYYFRPIFYLHVPDQRWAGTYDSFVTREFKEFWKRLVDSDRYDRQVGGAWFFHQYGDNLDIDDQLDRASITRILADPSCPVPAGSDWKLLRRGETLDVYANEDAWPYAFAVRGDAGNGRVPLRAELLPAGRIEISGLNAISASAPRTIFLQEAFANGWRARDQNGATLQIERNGLFMRIALRDDTQKVSMAFRPWYATGYRTLAMLLFALLSVMTIIVALRSRPGRKSPSIS